MLECYRLPKWHHKYRKAQGGNPKNLDVKWNANKSRTVHANNVVQTACDVSESGNLTLPPQKIHQLLKMLPHSNNSQSSKMSDADDEFE